MTIKVLGAILWDLYPPESSSPLDTHDDVKRAWDILVRVTQEEFGHCDQVRLYLLSSSSADASKTLEQLTSHNSDNVPAVVPHVISSHDDIEAFYTAKQDLDAREISQVHVVCCRASRRGFWTAVCRELFTPVHTWAVESGAPSVFGVEAVNQATVRDAVKRFLRTLPSLLGQPNVERSQVIPSGTFVHGYSTRRGGVSTLPTLSSMNLYYTDKKRDPQVVIYENLRRLAQVGGFDDSRFHIIRTEHGHNVWRVGREQQPAKYDALVTDLRGVTIAAAGADCIVLLFADPVAMVIGAAHAGWRGTVERVAAHVVRVMTTEYGSRPQDIRVALGPGLRNGCFRMPKEESQPFFDIHPTCLSKDVYPMSHFVGERDFSCASPTADSYQKTQDGVVSVVAQGKDFLPVSLSEDKASSQRTCTGGKEHLEPTFGGSDPSDDVKRESGVTSGRPKSNYPSEVKRKEMFVDLQLSNRFVLEAEGVCSHLIDTSTSHCTKCNPHLYFSYERDGFPFGNQIGFICMPSSPETLWKAWEERDVP